MATVNEITVQNLADYLRIAELTPEDSLFLGQALEAAKTFIKHYTGINDDTLNGAADLVIVVYVLVQDMYDTRTYYTANTNVNAIVENILNAYSVNLL